MFEVGDKIVYPMHGAGTVEEIVVKEFFGEPMEYLVLRVPVGHLRIAIPRKNALEIGVREVSSIEKTDQVLDGLKEGINENMPTNWSVRYRENLELLKTGDIFQVAEVVRNLTLLHREKGLSTGEKKMLGSAMDVLVSEMIVVRGGEPEEMLEKIEGIIGS